MTQRGEMAQAIFIGLSTIDIVYEVVDFPVVNSKVAANSQSIFVGGPATNAAIAFARFGGRASLVTAVGSHPLSSMVRQQLAKQSIHLIDLNSGFSEVPAISSISVDRSGNRNVVSANAARITTPVPQVDASFLKQSSIVLVDGHYMQACQVWAEGARANNIPVVLDGGSWKEGTAELLANVRTAVCSANFLPPNCTTKDEVIQFLKNAGVASVAITDGANPIHFASGSSAGTIRVPQVDVIDTMGAGDVFHGAYCWFACMGRGFVESLAEAANIASESCRYRGAQSWQVPE